MEEFVQGPKFSREERGGKVVCKETGKERRDRGRRGGPRARGPLWLGNFTRALGS